MDTYSLLREIADSWVLLAMFIFFIGVAIFAFLPSQAGAREDASMIPMRDDTTSFDATRNEGMSERAAKSKKTCSGTCDTCVCSTDLSAMRGLSNG